MKLQLKIDESVRRGFHRAFRKHVKNALAILDEPDQTEAIHGARKEIKKLRAVFRLARRSLVNSDYRKMSKMFRLAAKPLSLPRDAIVTQKALKKLPDSKSFTGVRSALKGYSKREGQRYRENGTGDLTRYLLRKVLKSMDNLKISHSGWNMLYSCLFKSYTQARRAYLSAMHHPTATNLHEWRKQVKNLRDQLHFICPKWPQRTLDIIEDLKSLGDLLGDDHDLFLLKQFVQQECRHHRGHAKLVDGLDSKRKEFHKHIFRLASAVFKNAPAQACSQLRKDWKNWRHAR